MAQISPRSLSMMTFTRWMLRGWVGHVESSSLSPDSCVHFPGSPPPLYRSAEERMQHLQLMSVTVYEQRRTFPRQNQGLKPTFPPNKWNFSLFPPCQKGLLLRLSPADPLGSRGIGLTVLVHPSVPEMFHPTPTDTDQPQSCILGIAE